MEKLSFPNRITVEVSNDCNIACTFCNRQKMCIDSGYMKDELFYKIIDEAAEHLPVKLVPFFRGEPLMHPNFVDLIRYAKSKGIGPIQMASNALLLDDKMQDDLIEAGIDYISFSLDTTDEEIYSQSRIYGDLALSAKNVENMGAKCKARRKQGLSAPTLQVSTIELEQYKPAQKDFIEKWLKHVDIVRIYEVHDEYGRLVDPEVRKRLGDFDHQLPCRKIFTDMIIYRDGKIALCNYDWDEKRIIGDVSKTSLQEAWNSAEFEKIRQMHLTGKFDDSICSKCHHWKIDYVENGFLGKVFYAN